MRASIFVACAFAACFATQADAVIVTPFVDTDGNPNATGNTIPDFDGLSNTLYSFTLKTDGTEAANSTAVFDILIDDPFEISSLANNAVFPNVTFLAASSTPDRLIYSYTAPAAPVAADLLIFDMTTGLLGLRPDDDLPDIVFSIINGNQLLFDPVGNANVVDLDLDVQAIPLPASALLLPAGLAMLAGFKRRRRTA